MGSRDRRLDAYIAQAAPFARPILTHLREVAHEKPLHWKYAKC